MHTAQRSDEDPHPTAHALHEWHMRSIKVLAGIKKISGPNGSRLACTKKKTEGWETDCEEGVRHLKRLDGIGHWRGMAYQGQNKDYIKNALN